MTCFYSFRIILTYPKSTINNRSVILIIYITQENKMSKKLVFIRNWEGRVTSTLQYAQDASEQTQQPSLVMYECLRSIVRKQCRFPFQLLKQYILFYDQQSSIQVGYKHMRHQLQLIEVNLKAFCSLMRQKMLIAGFITIKDVYQKKIRVQAAYGSIQNIECLKQSMLAIQNLQKLWLKWQVFGKLYQNFKGFKLSKISLSKIDMINNDFTSKQLMEFEPFLNDKMDVINSFIIDKSSEQHQQEENREVQQKEIQYKKLNIEKKSEIKQYGFKDNRVISERSVEKVTPSTQRQLKKKQTDELESKMLVTYRKQADLLQNMSSNKYQKETPNEKQYIYLIRDYRKHQRTPTNYIKIPLNTQNIEIVEVKTQKKKKRKKLDLLQKSCTLQQNCQNCKFCQQFSQRREIMKIVTQRLQIIRTETVNTISEFKTDFLGEVSQNATVIKSNSYHKSVHTAHSSNRQDFSAK